MLQNKTKKIFILVCLCLKRYSATHIEEDCLSIHKTYMLPNLKVFNEVTTLIKLNFTLKADIEKWRNKERMRNKARKESLQENRSQKVNKAKSEVTSIGNVPLYESPDEKKRRTEDWQSAQDEV